MKPVSASWRDHRCETFPSARWSSSEKTGGGDGVENELPNRAPTDDEEEYDDEPILVYEGPFASLSLRLKRISLTSAVIGIVGLPLLTIFQGGDGVPAVGQFAVLGTAGVVAVGSTALLGYCFSPYVHYLERLPKKDGIRLVRAITRDLYAREVETIFDPATDVDPPPEKTSRPFCNFVVKGLPMYVHPNMVDDLELAIQLVGKEEEPKEEDAEAKKMRKKMEEDDFL